MNWKISTVDDFITYQDSYNYLSDLLEDEFVPGYSGIPFELAVHINNLLEFIERTNFENS